MIGVLESGHARAPRAESARRGPGRNLAIRHSRHQGLPDDEHSRSRPGVFWVNIHADWQQTVRRSETRCAQWRMPSLLPKLASSGPTRPSRVSGRDANALVR